MLKYNTICYFFLKPNNVCDDDDRDEKKVMLEL